MALRWVLGVTLFSLSAYANVSIYNQFRIVFDEPVTCNEARVALRQHKFVVKCGDKSKQIEYTVVFWGKPRGELAAAKKVSGVVSFYPEIMARQRATASRK